MSRYHFIGRSRDEAGNVVPNVSISIYLAGTTTPMKVWDDITGGTSTDTAPQVISDVYGLFKFYVDDTEYDTDTLVDITVGDDTYENVQVFRVAGPSGSSGTSGTSGTSGISGALGHAYIYNLVPDTGNIDMTMAEDGNRVVSAVASPDVTQITVQIFAYSALDSIRPEVTVNGNNVTWSTSPSKEPTAYYGEYTLTMNSGDITVRHEDGNSMTITVSSDTVPTIDYAHFVNGYPGSQTELKENDNFDIRVRSDINFVSIEVEDSGACKSQIVSSLDTNDYTFTGIIADRGTSTQDMPARVRVEKSTGTWSDWVYTNDDGSTDGTHTVKLNNLYPSVESMNQSSITYPGSQEAIKDNESVTIHSTCSDYDTISYSSPTGELSIPNTSTYVEDKANVQRISGDYNITTDNYQITATRSANDATTTEGLCVYIAHVDPEITMSHSSYLRSGGNDGTSSQEHTITLNSNQKLISAPTVDDPPANEGTWIGSWVDSGDSLSFTRTLQVHDDDVKGSYSWGTLSATNLANKEVTSYTGSSTYTLRGFVSRDISLDAFANEASMNVEAVTYANVVMTWNVKSLPYKRDVGTTDTPDAGAWCLHTLNTNPTTIRILDTAATDSQSQESTITIEETV